MTELLIAGGFISVFLGFVVLILTVQDTVSKPKEHIND